MFAVKQSVWKDVLSPKNHGTSAKPNTMGSHVLLMKTAI